jgi:hypothetical protein
MITTYGQAVVAQWCGVKPATIAMWISRYPMQSPADPDRTAGWPEPDNETITPAGSARSWKEERKPEWRRYAAMRAESPGALLVAQRADRQAS